MSTAHLDATMPSAVARTKPLIGVTMGDPCGIGAEIIVKALADPELRSLGRFVIYGVEEVLSAAADAAAIRPFWFRTHHDEPLRVDSGVVVVDYQEYEAGFFLRVRPTPEGGRASLRFLDAAIEAARAGMLDALATAPINKTSWKLAGCKFPGHTEKLAEAYNTKRVTMTFEGCIGTNIVLPSTFSRVNPSTYILYFSRSVRVIFPSNPLWSPRMMRTVSPLLTGRLLTMCEPLSSGERCAARSLWRKWSGAW